MLTRNASEDHIVGFEFAVQHSRADRVSSVRSSLPKTPVVFHDPLENANKIHSGSLRISFCIYHYLLFSLFHSLQHPILLPVYKPLINPLTTDTTYILNPYIAPNVLYYLQYLLHYPKCFILSAYII